MVRAFSSLVLVFGVPWISVASAADEPDPTDARATGITEQLLTALQGKDVEAVMKLADVPFFWAGEEYIKDRKELRAKFAAAATGDNLAGLKWAVTDVWPATKLQACCARKLREEFSKELTREIDRIVLVKVEDIGVVAVLVRVRGGKASVRGVID